MIKVLVVGKYHSIVNWTENTVEAFTQSGCEVDYFAMNGATASQALYFKLNSKVYGDKSAAIYASLEKKLKQFQPDLVVFVVIAALRMPEQLFSITHDICPNAKKIAWIGDRLNQEESIFSNYVDWVFCTDSAFITDIQDFGYTVPASYLPLAVNPNFFYPMAIPRANTILYVANNSPERSKLISSINKPMTLYGKGWTKLKNSPHRIHGYRLPYQKLPNAYASCRAVLNVKNEKNVVNGLNQRSFEPYGCMTAVLNDAMQDLNKCFEPGKEILVYHNIDELYECYDRLTGDAGFAARIGQAGYNRVIAEHTYLHRAIAILIQVGLN